MKLIICEKPSLAKLVAEALGNESPQQGYIKAGSHCVTWCVGHMLEFVSPDALNPEFKRWTLSDLPLPFSLTKPSLCVKESAKSQYAVIKRLLSECNEVIHCGDPDEEGQLIVDEILAFEGIAKPVKRLLINNMNLEAAKKSLRDVKENDESFLALGRSALARSISDHYYGLNLTRLFTLKGREVGYDGVLSVGRVQTAMLGMVVKRTRANQSHEKAYYYDIHSQFSVGSIGVTAKYQPIDGDPVDEKGRIISEKLAQGLATGEGSVIKATHKEVGRSAPLPHSLSSLQSEASKRLGMKSDRTLSVLQALYEKHKLVTYPRSDCRYLSDDNFAIASDTLSATSSVLNALGESVPTDIEASRKHKAFNRDKVTAHTAIIPTENSFSGELSEEEKGLYLIIAQAFIALFLPQAFYAVSDIELNCGDNTWKTHKEQLISSGYLSYLNDTDKAVSVEAINNLESIKTGDKATLLSIDNQRKETKPPRLYTQSTFIKDLTRASTLIEDDKLKKALQQRFKEHDEVGGIGTPATRSSILAGLYERGFLCDVKVTGYKEPTIQPTELGSEFIDALPSSITQIDTTARWAITQTLIAQNERQVSDLTQAVATFVDSTITEMATQSLNLTDIRPICPTCNQHKLAKRKGKFGDFWGCQDYPECKAIFKDKGGKPDFTPKAKVSVSTEHHCPNCGKGMVKRKSKKGAFWGCSGYPTCKTTAFDKKGTPQFKSEANA